ncbi:hypothetical protein EDD11_004678 [Mortierella claussenii]|nr:hypothetical protein EDD11_004678 [Mortierella claussenii]
MAIKSEWHVKLLCTFQDSQYVYFAKEFMQDGDMLTFCMKMQRWLWLSTHCLSRVMSIEDLKPDFLNYEWSMSLWACVVSAAAMDTGYFDDFCNLEDTLDDKDVILR